MQWRPPFGMPGAGWALAGSARSRHVCYAGSVLRMERWRGGDGDCGSCLKRLFVSLTKLCLLEVRMENRGLVFLR